MFFQQTLLVWLIRLCHLGYKLNSILKQNGLVKLSWANSDNFLVASCSLFVCITGIVHRKAVLGLHRHQLQCNLEIPFSTFHYFNSWTPNISSIKTKEHDYIFFILKTEAKAAGLNLRFEICFGCKNKQTKKKLKKWHASGFPWTKLLRCNCYDCCSANDI